MLKKILQLIVVLLFTTSGVMAQTVEIDNVTVDPGSISVPLYMNDFTGANGDVGAITLLIDFDNDLLSFTGIDDELFSGISATPNSNGTVVIAWSELTSLDIDEKLLDLKFEYSGGFDGNITFDEPFCEIANGSLGTIAATYVNGSITQVSPVGSVSLDDVTEYVGNSLYMPITIGGAGFTAVDAITLIASYDETQLNYLGLAYTIPGMVGTATDGILTLSWTGAAYDFSSPETFAAVFAYVGGEAEINFLPGCEISSGLVPMATEYVNGTVSPEPTAPTLTVGEVEEALGNTVIVPVTATGFGGSDLGAITLHLTYDNALTYTGHTDDIFTGMLVTSNSNNELTIEWSDLNAGNNLDDADVLLNLNFTYGGGLAPITFDAGSLIQSINLVNIPTTLVDGSVTQEAATPTLSVAEVAGVSGNSVVVPITASGFGGSDLGAITLHLMYDNALVYTGHANDIFTGMIVTSNSSNELTIEWSNSDAGNNLADDDVLLELNFNYGGGLAPITFDAGSLIQSINLVNIPTTFVDGFVDVAYTVSGQLTYMGDVSRPVGTDGSSTTMVYLKNIADSTIAFSATTDVSGNYTFSDVFGGSYFLDAVTDIDAQYSYDLTDAFIIYGIGGTLTGLQALASDVNEIDGVDITDAFIVYFSYSAGNNKVPAWIAPDWIFENPVVVVSTNLTGEDFSAICSGDANGDFYPVP